MKLGVSQWVCRERNWTERGAANISVHSEHNMDYSRVKRFLFLNVFMNFVFISLQKKEGMWNLFFQTFNFSQALTHMV